MRSSLEAENDQRTNLKPIKRLGTGRCPNTYSTVDVILSDCYSDLQNTIKIRGRLDTLLTSFTKFSKTKLLIIFLYKILICFV